MILILEDDKHRTRWFKRTWPTAIIYDNAKEFINYLEEIKNTEDSITIFLDHDLGNETYVDSNKQNTGMEIVRWFEQNKHIDNIDHIFIHSLNTYAAKEMHQRLEKLKYVSRLSPFTSLIESK